MKQFWGKFTDSFCDKSVLDIRASKGIAKSDAVCRYLAYSKPPIIPVSTDSLCITVGVGGGSTDAGFWTRDRLIDQISVGLAGENILDPRLFDLENFKEAFYKICSGAAYHPRLDYGFGQRAALC